MSIKSPAKAIKFLLQRDKSCCLANFQEKMTCHDSFFFSLLSHTVFFLWHVCVRSCKNCETWWLPHKPKAEGSIRLILTPFSPENSAFYLSCIRNWIEKWSLETLVRVLWSKYCLGTKRYSRFIRCKQKIVKWTRWLKNVFLEKWSSNKQYCFVIWRNQEVEIFWITNFFCILWTWWLGWVGLS